MLNAIAAKFGTAPRQRCVMPKMDNVLSYIPNKQAALLVLIFLMPTLRSKATSASIDYIGAALLVAGSVPLLLGFTWA